MTRRVSLPGVDELFRSQKERSEEAEVSEAASLQVAREPSLEVNKVEEVRIFEDPEAQPHSGPHSGPQAQAGPIAVSPPAAVPASDDGTSPDGDGGRRPRHDEKVTFYCTASDLTRIERARLALRAEHKLSSDRGRIVRAALAEILDDFEANGSSSALVRRLRHDRSP